MKTLTIIKIGGNIVDKPEALQNFLNNFHKIEGPKILVHGGGAIATELSPKLGIEVKIHDGRRITDYETLKLVTMVYAGLINKQIIASLQKIGCNSIGLSGADGDSVPATKRSSNVIDWGYVGDVEPSKINISLITALLGR
ncbi:MAG: acetylglutamate kinase, partial [Bacteroidales bacterium]